MRLFIFLALAASVATAAALPAQQRGTGSGSTGPSELSVSTWPYAADAIRPDAPGITLLTASKWQLLIGTPASFAALRSNDVVRTMLESCRAPLALTPAALDRLANTRPWTEIDSATRGLSGMAISIVPTMSDRAECAESMWQDPAVVARGVRLVTTGRFSRSNSPARAALVVDGRAINAVIARREPLLVGAASGASSDSSAQMGIVFPVENLSPRRGSYPKVELQVWASDLFPPERVAIPSTTLDAMWTALLPGRIALAAAASHLAPIGVPEPADTELHESWRAYQSGDLPTAALRAFRRLGQPGVSPADQRGALVQLTSILMSSGDTTAARVVAGRLTAASPCLSLAVTAPAETFIVIDDSRPRQRCDVLATSAVLGAGIIVPGLGQLRTMHPATGLTALLASGILGALAFTTLNHANRAYGTYEASRSASDAAANYAYATTLRGRARVFATFAGLTWGTSAAQAAITEWKHARAVEEVRSYGAR